MTSGPAPLIGLTGRRKKGSQLVGNFESLGHLDGDFFYADYARGVLEAGGLPVNLPLDADPHDYLDRIDGVLFTGGADLDPTRYGAAPETDLYPPELGRDEYEWQLLTGAADAELPTLGICRGLQLINIHAGGTLHQHVPEHGMFEIAPDTLSHDVTFATDSTLAGIYGESRQVNSLHHQTVDVVGAGLTVTATADDGGVEGLEHNELPIVAVQWHPEMLPTRRTDPLFTWLVDKARERMS